MNLDHKIIRYISGACSDQEAYDLEREMRGDAGLRARVDETRKIWNNRQNLRRKWNVEEAGLRIRKEILLLKEGAGRTRHETEHNRPDAKIHSIRSRSWQYSTSIFLSVAVILLVLTVISILVVYQKGKASVEKESTTAYREVVTERGQRAYVQLPDGTFINLNVDSKLTYQAEPDPDSRVVHLSGEAFFDVAHDERPFYVIMEDAIVEVMGTSFNVEAYRDNGNLKVFVADGKVLLQPRVQGEARGSYPLERGDMSILQADSNDAVRVYHNADMQKYIGWLDQRLVFDDEHLDSVARKLERWYGIDIHLQDQGLAERRLTATFENKRLRSVLQALEISLGLDVRWQNSNSILLSAKLDGAVFE